MLRHPELFIWPSNIAGRGGQVWSSRWGLGGNYELVCTMDTSVDRNLSLVYSSSDAQKTILQSSDL